MKKYLPLFLVIFMAACNSASATETPTMPASAVETSAAHLPTLESAAAFFQITSPAFMSGLPIPTQFSCEDQNISPALKWTEPPSATKSLVLILDDPDAPGGTWNHWLVFNIPSSSRSFAEAIPPSTQLDDGSLQGITSSGSHGYQGPCPPSGTHRYFFKLYALDTILPLDSNAKKDDIEKAMEEHILASAELMGTFGR